MSSIRKGLKMMILKVI